MVMKLWLFWHKIIEAAFRHQKQNLLGQQKFVHIWTDIGTDIGTDIKIVENINGKIGNYTIDVITVENMLT